MDLFPHYTMKGGRDQPLPGQGCPSINTVGDGLPVPYVYSSTGLGDGLPVPYVSGSTGLGDGEPVPYVALLTPRLLYILV